MTATDTPMVRYTRTIFPSYAEITVEQKRINNALLENHNAIIKLVTKATSGYQSWERFRNGCMLILEKASILKSTRMTEALKWLKKGPEQQNVVRAQYQL